MRRQMEAGLNKCGEKKIVGHTEGGEGVSLRTHRADAKKALGSVHRTNVGASVVVLDGERSYTRSKETNEKTRINYEQGQYVTCVWVPVKEGEVVQETERVLKGSRFAILATESEVLQDFTRRV